MPCASCSRADAELHYSHAAGAVVCEPCHLNTCPPPTSVVAMAAYRKTPSPPPREPTRYAKLVSRVCTTLEFAGGGDIFYLEVGHVAGWCPVCYVGTVGVWFVDDHPPQVDLDGCSAGCTAAQVMRAFR